MAANCNADYVKVSQVLEKAFSLVPFSIFFNRKIYDVDKNTPVTFEQHFKGQWEPRFKSLYELGAVFVEAQDYAGVAVWIPPGPGPKKPPREEGSPAVIHQYDAKVKQVHRKHGIELEKSWFLHFLGRDPSRKEVKGAMSAVVVPFLARAQEEGVPAVLEAITEHGRLVYEHWGFRVIEQFELIDDEGEEGNDKDKYMVYVMVKE